MGAEPPSQHAVPSRGRCEMGPAPLGLWEASSNFFFFSHFEAPGGAAFCTSSGQFGFVF